MLVDDSAKSCLKLVTAIAYCTNYTYIKDTVCILQATAKLLGQLNYLIINNAYIYYRFNEVCVLLE